MDDKQFLLLTEYITALIACQSVLFRFLVVDQIIKKDELIIALDSLIEKFDKQLPNNNITTYIKTLRADISNANLRKDSDWLNSMIEQAGKNKFPS